MCACRSAEALRTGPCARRLAPAVGDHLEGTSLTERKKIDGREGDARPVIPPAASASRPSVHDLQRRAGNRATTAAIQRELHPGARAGGPALAGALASLKPAPAPHPAEDATAEADADAVASRVHLPTGPIDLPGSAILPPALAAPLRPHLGALDGVRVHSDDQATEATRAMGARAFTSGFDVYVDRAELATPDAPQLLAHEATHAVRHDPASVHAKMRGVKDALVQQGGGRSTKGIRRIVRGTKTNWDKIVDRVAAYEKLEADLLAKNPSPQRLAAARPKMVKALQAIEAAVGKWRQANDEAGAQQLSEGAHAITLTEPDYDHDDLEATPKGKPAAKDQREKALRRQAINMLLPRVHTELADVAAGQWSRTLGLSDAQLVETGASMSGQMNTVTELAYESEEGDFRGFFKADKGFDEKAEDHSLKVGIRQTDPNYAARSVAMYRLDQLLGAGVTARAEFAVHDGQMGLALESAKGTRASDANVALSRAAAQAAGPGAFSVDDAVLQRCLNKLQILDAIAGQLDRHGGNYYVQSEGGRVSGVTGIDLDMAFGQDMAQHDDPKTRTAPNYKRNLPQELDEEFGLRVLGVADAEVRSVLRGLLTEQEVEATIQRLQSVREAIRKKADSTGLRSDWDDPAAAASVRVDSAEDLNFGFNRATYASDMEAAAMNRIDDRVDSILATDARRRLEAEVPAVTADTIVHALIESKLVGSIVRSGLYEGGVPPEEEEALTLHVFEQLITDEAARFEIELHCQEEPYPLNKVKSIFKQLALDKKADIIASFLR